MGISQIKLIEIEGKISLIDIGNSEDMERVSVLQLKEKIFVKIPELRGYGDSIHLNYRGMKLDEDSKPLCSYGLEHMSTVVLSLILPGGGETNN